MVVIYKLTSFSIFFQYPSVPVVFVDYRRMDYAATQPGQSEELLQFYFVFLRENNIVSQRTGVISNVIRLCRVRNKLTFTCSTHCSHIYTHTLAITLTHNYCTLSHV